MAERAIALVNTFVNIAETNPAIINGPNGYSYLTIAGAEEILAPDPLLAKPPLNLIPHGTPSR